MATVWGAVQYIASKAGKTGLTVTVDVWALPVGNLAGKSEVATAQAAVEIGDGFYAFEYAGADVATNRYTANFHTADATVDRQDIGVWMVTAADYAEPGDSMALTAAAVDAVLDEVVEGTTTLRQMVRLMAAALFGDMALAASVVTFRDLAATKARITATLSSTSRDVTALDAT